MKKIALIVIGIAVVALCLYWQSYVVAALYSLLWFFLFRRIVEYKQE